MIRNANTYAYHVCIAGQGGLPMVEPVWASQEQNSFDPATSTPLPFIMGVDLSHEHEGRIFNDKGDCIQTFAFNVETMAGGWVDKHGVAAFHERQIGRTPCRERVCTYVWTCGVAVKLKK